MRFIACSRFRFCEIPASPSDSEPVSPHAGPRPGNTHPGHQRVDEHWSGFSMPAMALQAWIVSTLQLSLQTEKF